MPVRILQSKQLSTQGLTPQQGFESLQPVAKHLHQLRLTLRSLSTNGIAKLIRVQVPL
jgi:hypothetical protein